MPKWTKESEKIIKELKQLLPKGSSVYTILYKTSSTGMTKYIGVVVPETDKGELKIRDITYPVSKILGYQVDDKTGRMVIGGTGTNMVFSVVYSLSMNLYNSGYALKHKEL